VVDADLILVLERGRLVEQGTHAEHGRGATGRELPGARSIGDTRRRVFT
jgi:hypothetical protein